MGPLHQVQQTEEWSQGEQWQDFPWFLRWFHPKVYSPRSRLVCLSIYLFNVNVNIIQNKTQEQTLFSLLLFQCRLLAKSRFGPTASGKGDKKSPRKLQRLSVVRYTGLLRGVRTSSGNTVAHPFWPHMGEMDACTMLQIRAQKSQSRKRQRWSSYKCWSPDCEMQKTFLSGWERNEEYCETSV